MQQHHSAIETDKEYETGETLGKCQFTRTENFGSNQNNLPAHYF